MLQNESPDGRVNDSQRMRELLRNYLGVCRLCLSEHQHGIDLLQADEGAVADVVLERDSLDILLDS